MKFHWQEFSCQWNSGGKLEATASWVPEPLALNESWTITWASVKRCLDLPGLESDLHQEMISPGMNQKEGGIWFFLSSPWWKYIQMCKIDNLLKERIRWLWPSKCKQTVLFLLSIKPRVGCKRESEGSADLEAEIHQALKCDDEQQENCRKLIIYKFEPDTDMSNDVIITEALAGLFIV